MNIVIYSKKSCPNCVTAKRLLDSKGLKYTLFDVNEYPETFRLMLEDYPDARQMPQCFISGQRVGGLAGLQQALKELGL